jgi:hypothetical protein
LENGFGIHSRRNGFGGKREAVIQTTDTPRSRITD